MAKFCVQCGSQNDDQAAFCTACGQKFPELDTSAAPATETRPSQVTASAPAGTVLHFSLNKGEHKFILGELDFMDDVGKKVYHATRESALHENYTIFQGENKLAFMKHKIHLGGYSFEVQDGSGVAVGELHCKLHKGRVGEYWYTDQQDNIQAVVSWEGVLKFTLSDPGFSRIYAEASLDLPGGIIGDLKALGNRQSTVFIPYSSALPLSVILSFCVAIANMP